MANSYGLFFNSESGDRTYDAGDFAEWLKKFFTTGVFNGDLQVISSGGMDVTVGTGYANLEGKIRFFDTAQTFTLAAAGATYPRIDTVVVEKSEITREIVTKVVQGDYSGNTPTPKAPVRENGVYQIVLAQIRVEKGATSITQAKITDTRANNALCGLVVGTVDRVDVEQMTAQAQADFMAWYDRMKDQLSEDAAGNLQLEIDALDDKADGIDTKVDAHIANTENPHNVTKAQIGLGNVENTAVSPIATSLSSHIGNRNNPHVVTKSQVGLGNVENKSSATIRSEITSANIESALGYLPNDMVKKLGSVGTYGSSAAQSIYGKTLDYVFDMVFFTLRVFKNNKSESILAYTCGSNNPNYFHAYVDSTVVPVMVNFNSTQKRVEASTSVSGATVQFAASPTTSIGILIK